MPKIKYHLQEAISLRGLTMREAGLADPEIIHPKHWDEVIDFRTSIEMTLLAEYMPDIPLWVEVLGNPPNLRQKVKKGDWKLLYQSYRKYIKQCYEERGAGNPTAEDLRKEALKK